MSAPVNDYTPIDQIPLEKVADALESGDYCLCFQVLPDGRVYDGYCPRHGFQHKGAQ